MPEHNTYGTLRQRGHRVAVRRTLVQPVVTEVIAVLEPVGRDPFIDGPASPSCQSWRPRPRRRPAPAHRKEQQS